MKAILYGRVAAPAVAVVGVWDPLLPAHSHLFKRLVKDARSTSSCSLVIVIDPDPGILIWGRAARPMYDDLYVRRKLISASGIDAVLVLQFRKNDLNASATDFLNVVCSRVSLGELWLGADQSLGNGDKGSIETVRVLAQQRHIGLKVLPELGVKAAGYQARWFLRTGELRQAAILVGHPPLRTRPRSKGVAFAWREGTYRVVPVNTPTLHTGPRCEQSSVAVHLVAGDEGMFHLDWPDRAYRYLAFVEGPGDDEVKMDCELEDGGEKARLLAIVANSASLYDRLRGSVRPLLLHSDNYQVKDYLERWCKIAANGDEVAFEARLSQEGYDRASMRPLLGSVGLTEGAQLPSWLPILAQCVQAARRYPLTQATNQLRFLDASHPLPFEELFVPFVQVAREMLTRVVGKGVEQLSDAAWGHLERTLLQQITAVARQAVQLEYAIFKAQREAPLDRLLSSPFSLTSDQLFEEFAKTVLADGLLGFFEEYSVLGRLVATTTQLWIEATTEFLFRLERDRQELANVFNDTQDMGLVVNVSASISDSHNGGRSVLVLTFESGCTLVYKPKSLELEQEFARLQHWFNEHGVPLPFCPLQIVPRYQYGWVEFAVHKPCTNEEEVKRYFCRSGMLLCLIYVLEGTDCHSDNIVASGEYPQLVDLETLMHHRFQATEDVVSPSARALAEQRLWRSVLRTLFLPNWVVDKDGNSRDLGGLSSDSAARPHFYPAPARTNLPYISTMGESIVAADYVDELESGFQMMYEFLLNHRELLLTDDGPMSAFAEQQVRFVMRPTETYSALLERTQRPEFLRNGVARSLEIDGLSRIFIQDGVKADYWPVLRAEHAALEQLDVPYFTAMANETALHISEEVELDHFFDQPSYPYVINNLRQLSREDLNLQKQFIRLSFYADDVQAPSETPNLTLYPPLDNGELVAEAVKIAAHIAKTAIRASDGSITWIALQFHPHAKRYQLRPIGYELYGGSAGIALFLATLSKITGIKEYRGLALSAIAAARQTMPAIGRRFANLMGIGGFSGMGSITYVLACMAWLLDDEACIEDAYHTALSVAPELIARDIRYDIVDGAAGFLLTLLSLYEIGVEHLSPSRQDQLLELAVQCGNHLLEHRVASVGGPRVWPTVEGKLFSGFSHGAAGIAYALLRLHAVTADSSYQSAACEAIEYERRIFVPEERNWPHFESEPGKQEFLMQWCHGAPGVGLGRIAALSIDDSPSLRAEIDVAMAATADVGFVQADYLCCGNLGRARILLEGARKLARPDLEVAAKELVAGVIYAARQGANDYGLNWKIAHPTRNPGFMRGLSGIGYTLLEMTEAGQGLPVVLYLSGPALKG